MSESPTLSSLLYTHFAQTKLDTEALSINFGAIDARMVGREDEDVYFILSVPSDGFSYADSDIQVDKAAVEFEVHVANCQFNQDTHVYEWSKDKKYAIVTDPDRVNVFLYNNDRPLTQLDIDERHSPFEQWELPLGLNKEDCDDINELVCQAVKANSSRPEIIKAIESLLVSYQ